MHGSSLSGTPAESPADHKKGARVDISQDTDPEQTHSPPFQPLAESPSSIPLSIVSQSHPCGQSVQLAPALRQVWGHMHDPGNMVNTFMLSNVK